MIDATYIKMCDCPEIQEQSSKSEGNWWIGGDMVFCIGAYREEMAHEGYTWLPTQDQLQDMVGYKGLPYLLTQMFERSVNGGSCCYVWNNGNHFTSMEQLWLAFYMSEKHNKVWDGEKWTTH